MSNTLSDRPQAISVSDRLVIFILLIAAFVVILNETVMSVALPRLMEDLSISAGTAQWLTTAFMLTMAVLIPTTGFILQRLTTRQVFLLALSLFSAGTLLAGLAPGFEILLAARIVQASGTAMAIPLLMTTVLNIVPPARRGSFMGMITVVIAVAPAIGPTASGFIMQFLGWRYIFFLVLPIELTVLIIGAVRLTNVGEQNSEPVDIASVLLTLPAFGLLVFGLNQLEGSVGAAWIPGVALVVGAVSLLAFGRRQFVLQRTGTPLLDLRVLSYPDFRKSMAVVGLGMVALFGSIVLLPIYLQQARDLTTLATGLLLLPGGALMAALAPITGRLYDRYGPKALLMIGTGLLTTMLGSFALINETTPFWLIAVQYALLLGGGMGLIMTPAMTNGVNPLPQQLYSHGNATLMTLFQVAGGAGTALLVAIMGLRSEALVESGIGEVGALMGGFRAGFAAAAVAAAVAFVVSIFVRRAVPAGAPHGAAEDEAEPAYVHG